MKTLINAQAMKSSSHRLGLIAASLAVLACLSSPAIAAPSATFSDFTYSGPGCPAGSATPSLQSTAGSQFIVDFSQFNIPFNGMPKTKSCVLSAKITPSAGFKVSVQPAIYGGVIAKNTIGVLSAGHQFGALQMPLFSDSYKGPFTFNKTHTAAVPYTVCPDSAILKDDIKLTVSPGDPASGTVKKVIYTLQFQPC